MKSSDPIHITISPRSVFLFTLIPLVLYGIWIMKDLLFSLLIGFILMSAMRPAVAKLVARNIPRALAAGITYLLFILIFLSLIWLIIPPIIVETTNLIRSLPYIIQDISPQAPELINFNELGRFIPDATNNIFGLITLIFSNVLFVMATLFFGLYLLLEENMISAVLHRYFEPRKAIKIVRTIATAEKRMSSWFWGEVTLMTVVGTLTYIGLTIIGVKYALPLAVLAGLLEVVPNFGPTISAIPAIILGFSTSYFTGFSAFALYIIIQQLENNVIVPMIMKRAVGINPIVTLIVLLVGGRLGGVLGVLLGIPIFLFVETIIHEYISPEKEPQTKQ
ncbi:MAG: AI-2E family transporter [bacterium]|nr:AI-2E family transporter [bacterium]